MKVKFTQADLDAIEVAYYDNEGTIPCNMNHIPEQKEYQVLKELWHRMANKINKENEKNADD